MANVLWFRKFVLAFGKGGLRQRVLQKDELVYRWHNNDDEVRQFGRYVSPDRFQEASVARSKLGLPKENILAQLDSFTLKKRTLVFEGRVTSNFGHEGGAQQILIAGDLKKSLQFRERIK